MGMTVGREHIMVAIFFDDLAHYTFRSALGGSDRERPSIMKQARAPNYHDSINAIDIVESSD
jgi:hypothetical protein